MTETGRTRLLWVGILVTLFDIPCSFFGAFPLATVFKNLQSSSGQRFSLS